MTNATNNCISAVPMGDVCTLVNGRAFKPTEWGTSGLPIIRIQNLNDESREFNYYSGSYDKKHEVNSGDLLFSWSGTPGTSFGAFFWFRDRGVLNQHIFNVHVDRDRVEQRYFRYALNHCLNDIIGQAHGGVGLKHITKGKLEAIEIPLPLPNDAARSLTEQKRIADILDKADTIRRKRQEAIQQSRLLFTSVLEGELATRVNASHPIVPIGEVCTKLTDGTHLTPKFRADGIPFIFVKNIVKNQIDFNTEKFIDVGTYKALTARTPVEEGDVLYTIVGATYGQAALVETSRPFAFQRHIAHLKPNRSCVRPKYLAAIMNLPRTKQQADRWARGAAQPTLNLKELRTMTIPLPPLGVQDKLVSVKEQCERVTNAQSKSNGESDSLFNSLVQQAFRGEL